jgi:hypothetical protein
MYITSVGNVNMKNTATGDDTPVVLTLQTGELDIAAADVIGQIDFQAPDEAAGTDAILVAAGIAAVSEGDFSSSNNATKLSFKTASSAAAAETMSLSSGGNLTIAGDLTVSGDDITMATNTSGAVLVADGTNFNPVVMSGDATVATDGALTIANDAVSLAKMASGTDGNIISYDASGDPVAIATGDDGQVLTSAGAGAQPAFEDAATTGPTLSAETATTSGTSHTISSIPAGTKRITVMLVDVSVSSTGDIMLRLGDSGGLETTGYVYFENASAASGGLVTEFTTGFGINIPIANQRYSGAYYLTLQNSATSTWACTHSASVDGSAPAEVTIGGGYKTLTAELTQIALIVASGAFDEGAFSIMYD